MKSELTPKRSGNVEKAGKIWRQGSQKVEEHLGKYRSDLK
jgi:hypothetical protein